MGKRIKIGDVAELQTKNSLACAIYTHKKPMYGTLIRVVDGFFDQRPVLEEISSRDIRFSTFFPLQYAVSQGITEIIGNLELSKEMSAFPLLRGAGTRGRDGKVRDWYLWDGQNERAIGSCLSAKERRLSLLQMLNDTTLIERVEEGWCPEDES